MSPLPFEWLGMATMLGGTALAFRGKALGAYLAVAGFLIAAGAAVASGL